MEQSESTVISSFPSFPLTSIADCKTLVRFLMLHVLFVTVFVLYYHTVSWMSVNVKLTLHSLSHPQLINLQTWTDLDMGCFYPWVALGRFGLGQILLDLS